MLIAFKAPLPEHFDDHHAAAGRAVDLDRLEFGLGVLQLLLHRLSLLHQTHDVAHGLVSLCSKDRRRFGLEPVKADRGSKVRVPHPRRFFRNGRPR